MALKGTELIEKKNVLNELRSNNMTLQELRFFSIYLSKINARDNSTRVVRFPLTEFQKIMELGRMNIAHFKSAVDGLLCQIVHIPTSTGGLSAFQLFKECSLEKNEYGEWYVEIDAHDKALPLMFDFKGRYFTYELWNALRLKSSNQVRMYELLKQYEKAGKREIRTSELRELLGIAPNEYNRWERFKTRVLDSCQKSLAENTDISFTYERGKVGNGGKWVTIIFNIKKNENYVDQLTLDEFIDLQPAPQLVEEDDETKESQYQNEKLGFLAGACDYEFSEEEMRVLFDLLLQLFPSPKDELDRYNHLMAKYHETNANKNIPNNESKRRFGYMKWLLKKDIEDIKH